MTLLPGLLFNSRIPVTRKRRGSGDLFDNFFENIFSELPVTTKANGFLATDVEETDKEYKVRVDVPGVAKESLDISHENHVLTISTQLKDEKEEGDKNYLYKERFESAASRSIPLPRSVDAENIRADLKEGVLTIAVPKRKETQTKKISIN